MKFILAHDLGTSSNKAVVTTEEGEIVSASTEEFDIIAPHKGWAEQDPSVWWDAVCRTSRSVLHDVGIPPDEISAISFAGQMQGLLPVDVNGQPLKNCLIWLDARAAEQAHEATRGLIRFQGYGILRLLRWLYITNGAPTLSGKDPLAKMLWIRDNEPEIWERTHKFLDAKDFLVFRCTGRYTSSYDCGNSTWLMDTRAGHLDWSDSILRMLGIPREKLPELVPGTEIVGTLTPEAGLDLGLPAGVPIVAGAGDVAAMTVGTGAVAENEFHLAIGTSAWIATHVRSRHRSVRHYIASICSAHPERQLLVAHQETGGACLEWARTALGGWMGSGELPSYKDMDALAESYEAGADNLLFLPWMAGEYSPVEDPHARAGFVNLSFNHELGHMVRAIYEGVALNARWALNAVEKIVGQPADTLRFAGGGAASEVWCQILADVTNRKVVQIDRPQLAAARGAALLASHALGLIPKFDDIGNMVKARAIYEPREEVRDLFDEKYALFTDFYKRNRTFFRRANSGK